MGARSAAAKLDFARASFPVAALALVLTGQPGALNLALAALVVYAVRWLSLPRALDWSVLVAAAFLAWGNALSLYSRILYYDLLAHFFVQLLIAPCLFFVLLRATGYAIPDSSAAAVVLIFSLGLSVGALWEITEWTVDGIFGTSFVKGEADTMTDLIADACGAFIGATRFVAFTRARAPLELEVETHAS